MQRKSQASIPGLVGSAGRQPISSRSWPAPASGSMRPAASAGTRSTSVSGRVYVRGTKSETSDRWLNLPDWLVTRLAARAEIDGRNGYVFASPAYVNNPEQIWDQSNSANAVRAALDASEPLLGGTAHVSTNGRDTARPGQPAHCQDRRSTRPCRCQHDGPGLSRTRPQGRQERPGAGPLSHLAPAADLGLQRRPDRASTDRRAAHRPFRQRSLCGDKTRLLVSLDIGAAVPHASGDLHVRRSATLRPLIRERASGELPAFGQLSIREEFMANPNVITDLVDVPKQPDRPGDRPRPFAIHHHLTHYPLLLPDVAL